MTFKLDMKDLRILKELDQNPDITTSRLAKRTGTSQQVADYRLRNLMKNKVITSVIPLIDVGRLGYTLFRVHIRFRSISEEKKKAFEDEVFSSHKCFFIGSVGGRCDHYFDLFAESPSDFQRNLAGITDKFKEEIQEYETFTITRIHIFNYKYVLENIEPREVVIEELTGNEDLDKLDDKILRVMKKDSRKPYLQIGQEVGLARNAVKERIRKLEQRKIIAGNRIFLNSALLNKESYKLLLKLKGDEEGKQKIIQFAKINKNIIYALELMGRYDLDLEIEIEDRKKLQDLIIELRNSFPTITDYEIMPLFYDSGIDFFPIEKDRQIT